VKLTIDLGLKEALKPELRKLNNQLESLAKESDGYLGDLKSYVLIGSGKRVRPALVILGSRLGSANPDHVMTVAMAVELVHIATLVHDDVIDKAALRRGQKTVVNEHGVDAAVLLGDHIYTHAFERVAELGQPLVLQLLARSTSVMCSGEIDQLKQRFQFDLTEQQYFSFIEKKTASLFGASARSGAVLAGQSQEIQTALEQFGLHLGLAFQITDDLLDITGDEEVVGKTLRTDIMNGKMTLPLIHFRDQLSSRKEAEQLFENLRHPNGHIPDLIDQVKACGAMDYADRVARDHVKQALRSLDPLPAGEAKEHLTALAEMLEQRNA
jgi:geranylgeranyl pyrophosphate synthase